MNQGTFKQTALKEAALLFGLLFIGFVICSFLSILVIIYLRLDRKSRERKILQKLS